MDKYILLKFRMPNQTEWQFYFTKIEDYENGLEDEVEPEEEVEIARFSESQASSIKDQMNFLL